MSDYASFVTRITWCPRCSEAIVEGLTGPKVGPVTAIQVWEHPETRLPCHVVAGKVRDLSKPQEVIRETMFSAVAPRLCPGHSAAVVVVGAPPGDDPTAPAWIEVHGPEKESSDAS